MKLIIYLFIVVLPIACSSKTSPKKQYYNSIFRNQHPLNTEELFQPQPNIKWLRDTIFNVSTHMIKACITNIESTANLHLTLNGEVQSIIEKSTFTTPIDPTCNDGYYFTHTLILKQTDNIVTLEARNLYGAAIRHLSIDTKK